MPNLLKIVLSSLLAVGASALEATPIFQVKEWGLDTGVLGTPPNFGGVSITQIANPLQSSSSWISGPSSAATSYNFGWNDTFGDFLIQATHRAVATDASVLRTLSSGAINVTAQSDLLFNLEAQWTYYLPISFMLAGTGFDVIDSDQPSNRLFAQQQSIDTALGAPLSGTLQLSGSAILPGGHTYTLSYGMELDVFHESGATATADGYIHFTLSEVPEPAALVPLALSALLLVRKRRDATIR
jgi:hypothetical protein